MVKNDKAILWREAVETAYNQLDDLDKSDIDIMASELSGHITNMGDKIAHEVLAAIGILLERAE